MQTRDLMKLSLSHRIIIELASHIPILDLNHGYIPIQASAQCKWIIFSLSTLDLIPRKGKGSRILDAGFTYSLPPAASLRRYPPGLWVGVSPVLLVRWTAVKWVSYLLCCVIYQVADILSILSWWWSDQGSNKLVKSTFYTFFSS